MWNCFLDCVRKAFPGLGLFAAGFIVGGLVGVVIASGGAALTIGVVGGIVGIGIGAPLIVGLLACLGKCLIAG